MGNISGLQHPLNGQTTYNATQLSFTDIKRTFVSLLKGIAKDELRFVLLLGRLAKPVAIEGEFLL
jgi:hypothetical protein